MFEKIVLRRSESGLALTTGEVAEALLFYEKVHLVLDQGSLRSLIYALGTDELLALLARKRLSAIYSEDMLMARNDTIGSFQFHSFGSFVLSAKAGEQPRKSRKSRLELIFEKSGYSPREARKFVERFLKHVRVTTFSSNYFIPGGIPRAAQADLTDANYVTAAIRRVLQDKVGFESFAENLRVELIQVPRGFSIQSNINFTEGNARRKAIDPTLGAVTEGDLMVVLIDARGDTTIASHYGGDFYTSAVSSDIVRLRHAELLKRSGISAQELLQFKNIILPDYPTIREVINSGERTFDEFQRLLDKSDRFRQAIHAIEPDASLVEEYLREVTKEGWTSSLPVKLARYVFALAVGVKNPVAGAAVSAADTFLLDKLGKGWRPSHFVDGKLKPFLDTDR
jgi:hypothetical protein